MARWLIGRLRASGIDTDAQTSLDVIDAVLRGTTEVSAIGWHRRADFDRIDETKGTATPRG